jgi:hypothetical protein
MNCTFICWNSSLLFLSCSSMNLSSLTNELLLYLHLLELLPLVPLLLQHEPLLPD